MPRARVFHLTKEMAIQVEQLVERMSAPEKVVPFKTMMARKEALQQGGPNIIEADSWIKLPGEWTLGYTHEEISEGVVFRHMWLAAPIMVPPKEMTKLFMGLCGFVNKIENTVTFGHSHSEKPRRAAVNVIEPLAGDWGVVGATIN